MDLIRKEAFLLFAGKYIKEHPDTKESFDVDEKLMDSFLQFVREMGISTNEAESNKNLIKRYLAYEILKESKGKDIAEKVMLEKYDENVRRAIEILKITEAMHTQK